MIENNNFPWYLQQSDTFTSLYYGFFPVAEAASPLGFGDAFNIDKAQGEMLFRLGTYWGMNGDNTLYDGLIYSIDKWSETKVWTGGIKEVGEGFYRNMIKAKSYAFGRLYSLTTLKGVFERLFEGIEYSISVTEDATNSILITLTATHEVVRTFIEMKAFDLTFIGKPVGIKVGWDYNYTD